MKNKIILLCCAAMLLSPYVFSSTGSIEKINLKGRLKPDKELETSPIGILNDGLLTISFRENVGNVTIQVEAEDGTLFEERLYVEGHEVVPINIQMSNYDVQEYTIEISSEEGTVYGNFNH